MSRRSPAGREDRARRALLVARAAERLRLELEPHGIGADVRDGRGVALVRVKGDLVVWVEPSPEGIRYRWWTGRISERTHHYIYTGFPAHAVEAAARQIATWCAELRRTRPIPGVIAGTSPVPVPERQEADR